MLIKYLVSIIMISSLIACTPARKIIAPIEIMKIKEPTLIGTDGSKTDILLENILSQSPMFDSFRVHKKDWNIQIIYTQIDRGANNLSKLTDYYYNVNRGKYFYPASTVKLPTALLALEKLNELKISRLTRRSSMITESDYSGQTSVLNDPTTIDGRPTIENYIKKIFLVSDNDAFNRLYEFLGQEYLNDKMHKKGYPDLQILHRLQLPLSEDENRHTNPIKFYDSSNQIVYQQRAGFNQTVYPLRRDSLGKGYYQNGLLINHPMNFSKKNRVCLEDLHSTMRSFIFPYSVPESQRFHLQPDDYKFVLKYLSQLPSETRFPSYDSSQFPDAYGKFLLYGGTKNSLPKNIRIFNKIGDAYGQMIDIAYVVDFDKKIEFFLSAEIYCNKDEIMNDDKYDYESIGYPFMKNLGKLIYDFELKRKKSHLPDLSALRIIYDK